MVTMHIFLAIDAGGTSTRAVSLDATGTCLGYGTSSGGNPVSRGFEAALSALTEASALALTGSPKPPSEALIALAGASLNLPTAKFRDGFATLGLTGNVMIESDLLAAFYSGSFQNAGHALIAGTGAVAARVRESQLDSVADGTGWLLGDTGAGFWLGREVAKSVAADLDGRGPATALTALLLDELEIPLDYSDRILGRVRAQQQLIAKVYELRAIELSRFAPLVFTAPDDSVAADIALRAGQALAATLLAAANGRAAGDGERSGVAASVANSPLVFGGSVLTKGGTVATAVTRKLAGMGAHVRPTLVADGVVGAAVLVLKRNGVDVDETIFRRIQDSLSAVRTV